MFPVDVTASLSPGGEEELGHTRNGREGIPNLFPLILINIIFLAIFYFMTYF